MLYGVERTPLEEHPGNQYDAIVNVSTCAQPEVESSDSSIKQVWSQHVQSDYCCLPQSLSHPIRREMLKLQ